MAPLSRLAILLAALLGCVSCTAGQPWVELKGQKFTVEVADTLEKQTLGLMFREAMADDHGMIFVYDRDGPRSFWMKNTRIALDILYFDSSLALVSLSENTPPCRTQRCPAYPSERPAQYVLELNAGKAAELGLVKGDRLALHID